MDSFFVDYYERLLTLHRGFEEAVEGLSVAELDWSPGEGLNSIAVLIAHTAGAERYWVGDVAGEEPSGRIRSQEFETSGRTASDLLAMLAHTLARSQDVLMRLSLKDLDTPRDGLRDGEIYSTGWALLHALEHTATHLGHVHITRQLLDGAR